MALFVIFEPPIGRMAFPAGKDERSGTQSRAWGPARFLSQFGKELLATEILPPPGYFCEACQNKGDTGASVCKCVKIGDLEIGTFALQSLCFDMDAHCWCTG